MVVKIGYDYDCPYCVKAKKVFDRVKEKNKDFKYEMLNLNEFDASKTAEYQDYMKKLTGARSVPRVFIGGKCIGGGDDTVALEKNGKLEETLKAAGAL